MLSHVCREAQVSQLLERRRESDEQAQQSAGRRDDHAAWGRAATAVQSPPTERIRAGHDQQRRDDLRARAPDTGGQRGEGPDVAGRGGSDRRYRSVGHGGYFRAARSATQIKKATVPTRNVANAIFSTALTLRDAQEIGDQVEDDAEHERQQIEQRQRNQDAFGPHAHTPYCGTPRPGPSPPQYLIR